MPPVDRPQVIVLPRTERSRLLRAYRRVVPRPVRGLVARRMSPEYRNRILERVVTGASCAA